MGLLYHYYVTASILCRHCLSHIKAKAQILAQTPAYPDGFTDEDIALIDTVFEFGSQLRDVEYSTPPQRVQLFKQMFENGSLNMKIVIAKNITRIFKNRLRCFENEKCINNDCRDSIFHLFELCFAKDTHRYVRRPMASENICFCFIYLLGTELKEKARECLIRLIKDEDFIIPITTFDYISKIKEANRGVYNEIIEYYLNIEHAPFWSNLSEEQKTNEWRLLKQRAEHVRQLGD